jgi:hypothetical protein
MQVKNTYEKEWEEVSSRSKDADKRPEAIHVRFVVAQRLMKEEMNNSEDNGQALKEKLEKFTEEMYDADMEKWS